jgi:hypothetical protein
MVSVAIEKWLLPQVPRITENSNKSYRPNSGPPLQHLFLPSHEETDSRSAFPDLAPMLAELCEFLAKRQEDSLGSISKPEPNRCPGDLL